MNTDYKRGQVDMIRRVMEDLEVRKNMVINTMQYKIVNAKSIKEIQHELEGDKALIDEFTHIIRAYEDMLNNDTMTFEHELPF